MSQLPIGFADILHDPIFLGSFTPFNIYMLFFCLGFLHGEGATITHNPPALSAGLRTGHA